VWKVLHLSASLMDTKLLHVPAHAPVRQPQLPHRLPLAHGSLATATQDRGKPRENSGSTPSLGRPRLALCGDPGYG